MSYPDLCQFMIFKCVRKKVNRLLFFNRGIYSSVMLYKFVQLPILHIKRKLY